MTYEELTLRIEQKRSTVGSQEYAVMIPVTREEGRLSVLFEVRAATLRTHAGEVCLPGGRVEPGESPAQAARRELEEELGLRPPQVELGLSLPPAWHPAGFCSPAFLGRLAPGWRESLRFNPAEVAEIFTVPLDFFQNTPPEMYYCDILTQPPADFPHEKVGHPEGYAWRQGKMPVPLWMWEGRPIWGLTGRILLGLVKLL